MKKKRTNLCSAFVILSICLMLSACQSVEEDMKQGKISDLKSFSAFTLKNELFTQDSFSDYDITIIVFWAPWSEISKFEMGKVGGFAKKLPDNIQLITVCFDGKKKQVTNALKEEDMGKTTTLMSGDGDFNTVSEEIVNVPTTVFVNSKGKILGDPIVGAHENSAEIYLKALNRQLKKLNRKPVSLEEPEEATTEKTKETSPAPEKESTEAEEETEDDSTEESKKETSDDSDSDTDSSDSDSSDSDSSDSNSDEEYDESNDESYDEEYE